MPPRKCRSKSPLTPRLKVDEQTVAIRIGCNFGPVVLENRDIFGSAVHTANRMTSQAKAGQIMTTATMVEQLSSEWRASVRQIDIATLKGRSSEVALFEVLWQTEDITSMVPAIAVTSRERANKTQRLRLRYQGQEVLVHDARANITMGRAEENDLVVKGNLISRLHARVEINRNKFMLIDQSTNGTFVLGKDGEEAFVRRDSMQIRGEGLDRSRQGAGQQLLAGDSLRLRGVSAPGQGAATRAMAPLSSIASACGNRSPNSAR